jgi:hypothetical protein
LENQANCVILKPTLALNLLAVLTNPIVIILSGESYMEIDSLILPKSYHPNSPGYDYGARGGKTLSVFVEDLNLPQADMYGVQEVNEVMKTLRELVAGNGHVLCIEA